MLGGVEIPFSKGLEGHSDADVLVHAICDALLGALAQGDMGTHFPDTDPQYKGASSLELLRRVVALMEEKGFQPVNLDTTIVCQEPRLAPFISEMVRNITGALKVTEESVNVKATSPEGLGFIGRGEGIEAYAVVSLSPRT
jgi:2-C-methyl-D-erythritol 2,4-cyclodiphosphate synthase